MRHPSRIVESMFFSGLILFSIIWMSGVPIIESVELSLLLAIQVSGGAALWYTVNKSQQIVLPAAIGMGLALGTSITTLSQYLLRETVLSDFSWAIPLVFLIPAMNKSRKYPRINVRHKFSELRIEEHLSLTIIFTLVVLAMASLWWWIFPLVAALSCICFLQYQRTKKKNTPISASLLSIPISVIGIATSLALRQQNSFWKILSNDQVFSESLSWSIFKWGNSESPFVSGTPVSYHWFVLLWSGITSSATNAQSWVVIGQVLPVVSFLGMFCLIWAISKDIYSSFSAPIIAILFLIFYSNSFGFSLTRYIVSPTFLFSCVWLLAFANSSFCFLRNPTYKLAMLSSFLLFMSFGGKVMNGAVGISALLFALSIWFFRNKLNPNRIKILFFASSSVLSLILIHFFMYSQNQPGNLNTLVIRSLLPLQLGLLPPDKDGIYLVSVNSFLFVSMMLPLTAVGIYSLKRTFRDRIEVWFVVGSILSGLILTFMTSHPGASQLYFWLASMVFVTLLIPAIFFNGVIAKFQLRVFLPYVLIAIAAAYVNIEFWNQSNLNRTGYESLKLKAEGLLVGLLIVFIFPSIFFLLARNSKTARLKYGHIIFLSVFVLFNLGFGVKQQFTNLIDRSQIQMSNENDQNLITGSRDHLQILNWIRVNSDESDVIATNRFCIPGLSYCISKWQLVSAVSHRKMLFEGGYYELPNIPDQEILSRYVLSSEFGQNPSPYGLDRMCDYGVKWYFFDHSVAEPLKTWEPYADIQLQNEGASLLRLRCPTG